MDNLKLYNFKKLMIKILL